MNKHTSKARKRFGIEQSVLKAFDEKDLSEVIREFEESCNTMGEEGMKQQKKLESKQGVA